jgi:hypothetical protein
MQVSLVRARIENGDSPPDSQEGRTSAVDDTPAVTVVKSLRHAQVHNTLHSEAHMLQNALADLLREPLMLNGQHVVAFDCKFVSLAAQTPEFLSLVG